MDLIAQSTDSVGRAFLPEVRTELRWQESALWPVRRPYPIDVPCPVCGTYTRCNFFGRQRCTHGHVFGQRAFWSGKATSCWLLLEDVQAGYMLILADAPLHWHDEGRLVVSQPPMTAGQPAPEALL